MEGKKKDPDIAEIIKDAVEQTVNGKIDDLRKAMMSEFEAHQKEYQSLRDEIEPIVDVVEAAQIGKRAIVWVAGLLVAVGSIIAFFKFLE